MTNYIKIPLKNLTIHHIHFNGIDSTQKYALANMADIAKVVNDENVYCIDADFQTSGIGKLGVEWRSPEGNVSATFVLQIPSELSNVEIIQRSTLCICKVLEEYGVFPKIKWINDLLLNDKKICGVLCDTVKLDSKTYLVIGVGVNVKVGANLENTTSITHETQIIITPNNIVLSYASKIMDFFKTDYSHIVKQFEERMWGLGQNIECEFNGNSTLCNIIALEENGFLKVKTDDRIEILSECKIQYKVLT